MAITLYLVRSGSAVGGEGRCIGRSDPVLSDAGERAIRALAESWHGGSARFVASDLERSVRSATAFAAHWPARIAREPRLREMHYGAWDGQLWSDLEVSDGARLERWRATPHAAATPDGEAFPQVADRASAWLSAVADAAGSGTETIIAFAHEASIRATICRALALPLDRGFRLHVDHAGVTGLIHSATGWELLFANAGQFPRNERR
ncbi:MAG: histidine phosphatase family protein [Gemmatimonadaceae bacterium]